MHIQFPLRKHRIERSLCMGDIECFETPWWGRGVGCQVLFGGGVTIGLRGFVDEGGCCGGEERVFFEWTDCADCLLELIVDGGLRCWEMGRVLSLRVGGWLWVWLQGS